MNALASIKIWNVPVGVVSYSDSSGLSTFEYEDSFIKNDWNLSPLLMPQDEKRKIYSFPELKNSDTFKTLPGLLADVLPDRFGSILIQSWQNLYSNSGRKMNPVDYLKFIGKRGIGALEFEPDTCVFNTTAKNINIRLLINLLEKVRSEKLNNFVNLSAIEIENFIEIFKICTTVSGDKPKAFIAYNPVTKKIKSAKNVLPKGFQNWQIKFYGIKEGVFSPNVGYGRVELAYHKMAAQAGIEMTECCILEENGRSHFMSKRLDRDENNEKIHFQSFGAIRHFDFRNLMDHSYEQLFETMRLLRLPYSQKEQMFRRMVFNVLSGNRDDHVKNHGFIMSGKGEWSLAPAIDVSFTFKPGSQWINPHALSINGKRTHILNQDMEKLASEINLKKAKQIINEIKSIVLRWPEFAEESNVDSLIKDKIYSIIKELSS